jgi:hypothetical protein
LSRCLLSSPLTPLMTDEAMNQAFGMSFEDEEDEAEEVSEEEADGGQ